MNYNIELTEKTIQPVLSIRTTTSLANLPKEIGRAYGAIMMYLNEIGENPVDAPFTAYYNLDMENLDVEMGFPVGNPFDGKGEIIAGSIPAGKYVSCTFKGPYQQMEALYSSMNEWVNKNGYTATGVSYEYYYNSPVEVPESELLTKVVFPVK